MILPPLLYNENHSLSERFKKAYGDKEKSLLKLLSGLPTASRNVTGSTIHYGDEYVTIIT